MPGWGCPRGIPVQPSAIPTASASAKTYDFGAQWHGLHTPCVRLVGGVTPALHATLGTGWSLAFAGRGEPRWVRKKVSAHEHSPSPGFAWRTGISTLRTGWGR